MHLPPGRCVQAGRRAHLPGRSRGLPGVGLRHRSPRAATPGIGPQEPTQYSGRRPRRHEVSKGSTRFEVGLQSTLARDLAWSHFGGEEQRAAPKQPISEGTVPHGPLEVVVHAFRPLPGRKRVLVLKCQVWEGYAFVSRTGDGREKNKTHFFASGRPERGHLTQEEKLVDMIDWNQEQVFRGRCLRELEGLPAPLKKNSVAMSSQRRDTEFPPQTGSAHIGARKIIHHRILSHTLPWNL